MTANIYSLCGEGIRVENNPNKELHNKNQEENRTVLSQVRYADDRGSGLLPQVRYKGCAYG